jgi:hypothetical protein
MNKHTFLKNSTIIAVIVILAGMLRSSVCHAQENDCFLNNIIGSDSFKVIHTDKQFFNHRHRDQIFTGHVVLQIFRDTVTCDTAVLHAKTLTIIVSGHVITSSKIDISGASYEGATFFLKSGVVLFATKGRF